MEFSIWEYILPTGGLFAVSWLLLMCVCVYYVRAKIKAPTDKSIVLFIPFFCFIFMILSLVNAAAGAQHWGGLLVHADKATTFGTIESIEKAGYLPVYWNTTDKTLSSAYYIIISGEEYYILSDQGMNVGDEILITYCPEGNTIIEWKNTTTGTNANASLQNIDTVDIDSAKKPLLLTEQHLIVLFGIVLVSMWVLQKPFSRKRLRYIRNNNPIIDGLVYPRKLSVMTCTIEFLLTGFVVVCFLTRNLALSGFISVLCICFWGLRFLTQNTMVMYQDDEFSYTTFGATKIYKIAAVRNVYFSPTRQTGCLQLEIVLSNRKKITLEELNFVGLEQFYIWLRGQEDGLPEP